MSTSNVYKTVIFFLFSLGVFSQELITYPLEDKLREASGLEQLNDSTLVIINDGGNNAELYLIDLKGAPIKTVSVVNAKNTDWEDLARDEEYLYIGDIGNNKNNRQNLCVYKVKIKDVLTNKEVTAEKIAFNYYDQKEFPPSKEFLNFDSEGMIAYRNAIFIFSKNRTVPFSGTCTVYSIPKEPGTHTAKYQSNFTVGDEGWWKDAVTAVDIFEEEIYVLTYNRVFKLNIAKLNEGAIFESIFERTTQKEAVLVIDKNTLMIADEKQKIVGGGNLYKMKMLDEAK